MKRKCYAKDHVTVRLTFEEFSVLTSAINFDIVSTCRHLDNLDKSNVLTQDYELICQHRLSVLRSLNDIFPLKVD
nr:MAG TPA: hypothetical protein [Microviridae sp.]